MSKWNKHYDSEPKDRPDYGEERWIVGCLALLAAIAALGCLIGWYISKGY